MIYPKEKKAPGWKNYDNCSIGISLQSQNHIGERFEAIVDWVNGKFDYCLVDLSDTLHRYNYMIEDGLLPEQARAKALNEGDKWLQEHQQTLDNLSMPYKLIRWDHWMDHPRLKSYKDIFWHVYETNESFKNAVLEDVSKYYIRRHNMKLEDVSPHNVELSISYLVEELAVHSIFFENYNCASVYPGRQQACFKMIREGLIKNTPTFLQNSYFVPLFLYEIDEKDNNTKKEASSGMSAAA